MKLTHEQRIERALKAKAAAEAKLKRLADADAKRKADRLVRLADKTGLLDFSDEVLLPEIKAMVERLKASAPLAATEAA